MNTIKKVAKNTGIVMGGEFIFRMISLVVTIYLARYLGTDGFGNYNFIFAYLAFFDIIADLGLQRILIREMSGNKSIMPKLIGNAYFLRTIFTVIAISLSIFIITLMPYPVETIYYVYIASLTLLFISFSEFYSTIFQAHLRMEYSTFSKLVFKIISTILIFWVILSHGKLVEIILVLVLSEMVKTLLNYVFARQFVRPQFTIDFDLWKYLLKESLPVALSSVIFIIYHRIDVLMLSLMSGNTAVGLYSAAYKLSEPLSLIPHAILASLFPIMSKFFKNNSKDRLIKSYSLGVRYLLIISLPIAVGTTLLADRIILLIYGMSFSGSSIALQILIWAFIFNSLNSVLINLLISINKQKLNTLSMGICAIVNVILNFILIPILSYKGAAIATVVTLALLLIMSLYFVSKHLKVPSIHIITIKPVISSLFMGCFVYYFIYINIFLLVFLAAFIYVIVLLILKEINKDDINILKKVLEHS